MFRRKSSSAKTTGDIAVTIPHVRAVSLSSAHSVISSSGASTSSIDSRRSSKKSLFGSKKNSLPSLHSAVVSGNLKRLKSLLKEKKRDLNKVDRVLKGTALHHAAALGNVDCLRLILDASESEGSPSRIVNLNAVNVEGKTPLILATANRHAEFVRILVERGADVNRSESAGSSPLHYATVNGDVGILSILLQNRANVDGQNNTGATCLHNAVRAADEQVVKTLIGYNADPNVRDSGYRTPLHIAVEYRVPLDLIRILLEAGSVPTSVDAQGKSPIEYAQDQGLDEIGDLLTLKAIAREAGTAIVKKQFLELQIEAEEKVGDGTDEEIQVWKNETSEITEIVRIEPNSGHSRTLRNGDSGIRYGSIPRKVSLPVESDGDPSGSGDDENERHERTESSIMDVSSIDVDDAGDEQNSELWSALGLGDDEIKTTRRKIVPEIESEGEEKEYDASESMSDSCPKPTAISYDQDGKLVYERLAEDDGDKESIVGGDGVPTSKKQEKSQVEERTEETDSVDVQESDLANSNSIDDREIVVDEDEDDRESSADEEDNEDRSPARRSDSSLNKIEEEEDLDVPHFSPSEKDIQEIHSSEDDSSRIDRAVNDSVASSSDNSRPFRTDTHPIRRLSETNEVYAPLTSNSSIASKKVTFQEPSVSDSTESISTLEKKHGVKNAEDEVTTDDDDTSDLPIDSLEDSSEPAEMAVRGNEEGMRTAEVPKPNTDKNPFMVSTTSELDDIRQRLLQTTSERDALQATVTALHIQITKRETEVAGMSRAQEELLKQFQSDEISHKVAIDALQSETDLREAAAKRTLRAEREARDHATDRVAKLEADLAEAVQLGQANVEKANESVKRLGEETAKLTADLESEREKQKVSDEKLVAANAEVENLRKEVKDLSASVNKERGQGKTVSEALKDEQAARQRAEQERDESLFRNYEITEEFREAERRSERLRKEVEEKSVLLAEQASIRKSLEDKISALRAEVSEEHGVDVEGRHLLELEVHRLLRLIEEERNAHTMRERESREALLALSELESNLAHIRRLHQREMELRQNAEQETIKARSESSNLKGENMNIQRQLFEQKELVSVETARKTELEALLGEQKVSSQRAEQEIIRLREENTGLSLRIKDLTEARSLVEQAMDEAKAKLDDKHQKLVKLQTVKEDLEKKIKEYASARLASKRAIAEQARVLYRFEKDGHEMPLHSHDDLGSGSFGEQGNTIDHAVSAFGAQSKSGSSGSVSEGNNQKRFASLGETTECSLTRGMTPLKNRSSVDNLSKTGESSAVLRTLGLVSTKLSREIHGHTAETGVPQSPLTRTSPSSALSRALTTSALGLTSLASSVTGQNGNGTSVAVFQEKQDRILRHLITTCESLRGGRERWETFTQLLQGGTGDHEFSSLDAEIRQGLEMVASSQQRQLVATIETLAAAVEGLKRTETEFVFEYAATVRKLEEELADEQAAREKLDAKLSAREKERENLRTEIASKSESVNRSERERDASCHRVLQLEAKLIEAAAAENEGLELLKKAHEEKSGELRRDLNHAKQNLERSEEERAELEKGVQRLKAQLVEKTNAAAEAEEEYTSTVKELETAKRELEGERQRLNDELSKAASKVSSSEQESAKTFREAILVEKNEQKRLADELLAAEGELRRATAECDATKKRVWQLESDARLAESKLAERDGSVRELKTELEATKAIRSQLDAERLQLMNVLMDKDEALEKGKRDALAMTATHEQGASKLRDMKRELATLRKTYSELERTLLAAKDQNASRISQLEQANGELVLRRQKEMETYPKIEELVHHRARLEVQLSRELERVNQLEGQLSREREKCDQIDVRVERIHAQLDEEKAVSSRLRIQLAEVTTREETRRRSDLDTQSEKNAKISAQIASSERRIRDLSTENDRLRTASVEMGPKIEARCKETYDLKLQRLVARLDHLQRERDRVDEERSQNEVKLKNTFELQISAYLREIERLKALNEEERKTCANAVNRLRELTAPPSPILPSSTADKPNPPPTPRTFNFQRKITAPSEEDVQKAREYSKLRMREHDVALRNQEEQAEREIALLLTRARTNSTYAKFPVSNKIATGTNSEEKCPVSSILQGRDMRVL